MNTSLQKTFIGMCQFASTEYNIFQKGLHQKFLQRNLRPRQQEL